MDNAEVLVRLRSECREKEAEPYSGFQLLDPPKTVNLWRDVVAVLKPMDTLVTVWSQSSSSPRAGRFYLEIFDLEKRIHTPLVFQTSAGERVRRAAKEALDKYFGNRHECVPFVLAAVLTPQYLISAVNQDQQALSARLSSAAYNYIEQAFAILFPERWNELEKEYHERNGEEVGHLSFQSSVVFHQWTIYRTFLTLRENLTSDTDPFVWWRSVRKMLPDLYMLARVFLAIPMSSTTIERLWSKLKRVLTKARGNLDPDLRAKQVWCHEFRVAVARLEKLFAVDAIPTLRRVDTDGTFSMAAYLKAHGNEKK